MMTNNFNKPYESRVVANQISKVMGKLYPASWSALTDNEGE